MNPYLIASYPRSGSTWLRFILCNLFYPETDHNFDTVNRLIPGIDNEENMKQAEKNCLFYKTHSLRHGQNVIFLYRHVGDVLISEYWYKKKFGNMDMTLTEWFEFSDYGANWRTSIYHYFPCKIQLSYRRLSEVISYKWLFDIKTESEIKLAIEKSSFNIMREKENEGFGIYESGDKSIKFMREGKYGQYETLPKKIKDTIISKNYTQLKVLGYDV